MATRKTRRTTTPATGKAEGARGAAPRRTMGPRPAAKKTSTRRRAAQQTAGSGAASTGRSKKAGRPPAGPTARPQARRRQRSATTAVKKDGMRMQTDQGTKVLWGANQRRPTRV